MSNSRDAYTWQVTYNDDWTIDEYDVLRPDGRGFAEIGGKPVKNVTLLPTYYPLQAGTHWSVLIPDGAAPVFFRRRSIKLATDGNEAKRSTVHCIGWKQEASAVYLFVFEDGSTLLSDDLQAV